MSLGHNPDDKLLNMAEVAAIVRAPVAAFRYWRHVVTDEQVGRGVRYWRSKMLR